MKWVIERDAGYRDRVDVNKQWVKWKKTTVLQLVVIFCRENLQILFYKIKMHPINTVLVGYVSYFSWLRIKLQALQAISCFKPLVFPLFYLGKSWNIFHFKS